MDFKKTGLFAKTTEELTLLTDTHPPTIKLTSCAERSLIRLRKRIYCGDHD